MTDNGLELVFRRDEDESCCVADIREGVEG